MKVYISLSIMLLMSIFLSTGAIAQKTAQKIGVKGINAENYTYPFAGGMNACQFGEIDINMDGIKDLIAFDRQGNRLMPFINHGTPNTVDYTWEPQYIEEFPDIYHWMILTDYNMDGKADLFTYNPVWPGIIVYKNISTYELRFERVAYPFLTSWYGSGYVNILVTYADYPGISDLDGDGDLDILTFIAVGSFVEMHKNLSMETYGHADSLIFEHTTWCWGYFAESEESNDLFLDTCYGSKDYNSERCTVRDRHTGSTFLLTDLDNDQDKDLLLGDVDYPTLIYMLNGGDQQEAVITFYDQAFPHENNQVRIFSMPVAALIDVNNDGIRDLLVSPFDPSPFVSMNLSSVWYYSNDGSNEYPDFNLRNKRFLQENMIDGGSGAYPAFADINLDGLYDLIIGNYGYYKSSWYDDYMVLHSEYASQISLFMNSGEPDKPQFEYETADFGFIGEMNLYGAYPAFGDIDTDDDADMIVGRDDGTLMFYRNCSCLGNPEDFELEEVNYQGIDVGDYSTPFLFDIDEDGLIDLIIGERGGNLNYYKNTGDLYNPAFTLVTDSLGKVMVTDFNLSWDGYSTPYVFRANDGKMRLISGSEQGIIYYFTDIEGNLEESFTPADDLWKLIDTIEFNILPGYRTSAAIADIDMDGYLDLAVGNFSGGLNFYSTETEPPVTMDIPQNINEEARLQIFPNPANDYITIKADLATPSGAFIIQLYNMNGVKVFEDAYQENVNSIIKIGNLANGVYLCVIRSDADYKPIASGKFIVER